MNRRQFIASSSLMTAGAVCSQAAQFTPTHPSMSQHKVLVIIGDATETVDTLYPYYRPCSPAVTS